MPRKEEAGSWQCAFGVDVSVTAINGEPLSDALTNVILSDDLCVLVSFLIENGRFRT